MIIGPIAWGCAEAAHHPENSWWRKPALEDKKAGKMRKEPGSHSHF